MAELCANRTVLQSNRTLANRQPQQRNQRSMRDREIDRVIRRFQQKNRKPIDPSNARLTAPRRLSADSVLDDDPNYATARSHASKLRGAEEPRIAIYVEDANSPICTFIGHLPLKDFMTFSECPHLTSTARAFYLRCYTNLTAAQRLLSWMKFYRWTTPKRDLTPCKEGHFRLRAQDELHHMVYLLSAAINGYWIRESMFGSGLRDDLFHSVAYAGYSGSLSRNTFATILELLGHDVGLIVGMVEGMMGSWQAAIDEWSRSSLEWDQLGASFFTRDINKIIEYASQAASWDQYQSLPQGTRDCLEHFVDWFGGRSD